MAGLSVRVIAAGGAVAANAAHGTGRRNPSALASNRTDRNHESSRGSWSSRSVSLLVTYGNFRTIIMGT